MTGFLASWLQSIWNILLDSALFLMLGLLLAGGLWLVLSARQARDFIRRGWRGGVLRAAVVGIPLPLCSCSVLPVAAQLRKAGVGPGATSSFLISTPETGVDSILLTYSLTDPLMTVARPVVAFLTALAAGVINSHSTDSVGARDVSDAAATPGQSGGATESQTWLRKVRSGVLYAFNDLLRELSPYLLVGFVLAGLVDALLGSSIAELPLYLKSGWPGYAGAILVGLPMYICATSSTPLAAVLLGYGFSPGAILVFLLVGPATNLASLAVLRKLLGGVRTARYLIVIVVMAVLSGLALDQLYGLTGLGAHYVTGRSTHTAAWYDVISAAFLGGAVLWFTAATYLKRLR